MKKSFIFSALLPYSSIIVKNNKKMEKWEKTNGLRTSPALVPYFSIYVKKNKKFGWGTWVAGFPR